MLTTLIIVSILALCYFFVAKAINKVSKQKMEAWKAGNQRTNQPDVIFLPAPNVIGIISGIVLLCAISFSYFVVSVGPQEVAVVKTPRGVKETPLTTGWHFVLPWWDTYKMDKTVWVYTFTESKTEGAKTGADAIWAPTSEGIKMGFDMSVSWRIDPAFAPWIFQNVSEADGGPDGRYKWIEENVIRTKTKSVFALTACKFTPIQCYSTGRQEIQNIVDTELRKELTKYHIILDQVDIREVFYDPGYEAELKNKKIQEQKALTLIEVTKQKNEELTQAKINKDIAIEQAEGEAKSLQIKGNSITNNPRIIELEWINKWNGALPNYMMGGNSNMMMTMPAPTQR